MTHFTPAATLSWAIVATVFEIFLLNHLWQYDRFKCLRFTSSSAGQNGGAFKRIMTLAYLISVPLLMVYSGMLSYIKYNQGWVDLPFVGIRPKPFQLWPEDQQQWISPLYYCLGISWALEITTHGEELAFWLFLLHQIDHTVSWFQSLHFKLWLLASLTALATFPILTFYTHPSLDPLTSEAYIFLVGSITSTLITLLFLRVLWKFPAFLRVVHDSIPDRAVWRRLKRVHRLNVMRVVVRCLFTIPLGVLAVDGLLPGRHVINESFFGTDLCIILAGLSCIVSSAITLHIFFPIETKHPSEHPESGLSMYEIEHRQNPHPDPFAPPLIHGEVPIRQIRRGASTATTSRKAEKLPLSVPENVTANHFQRESIYSPSLYSNSSSNHHSPSPSDSHTPLPLEEYLDSVEDLQFATPRVLPVERIAPSPSRKSSSVRIHAHHPSSNGHQSRSTGSLVLLHPYIATFTSPIELVTLPSSGGDRLPRAI